MRATVLTVLSVASVWGVALEAQLILERSYKTADGHLSRGQTRSALAMMKQDAPLEQVIEKFPEVMNQFDGA